MTRNNQINVSKDSEIHDLDMLSNHFSLQNFYAIFGGNVGNSCPFENQTHYFSFSSFTKLIFSSKSQLGFLREWWEEEEEKKGRIIFKKVVF